MIRIKKGLKDEFDEKTGKIKKNHNFSVILNIILLIILLFFFIQAYNNEKNNIEEIDLLKIKIFNQSITNNQLENKIILLESKLKQAEQERDECFSSKLIMSEEYSKKTQSPGDWINEKKISALSNKVIIELNSPIIASFADTKSMIPVLNNYANGIEIEVKDVKLLKKGDIISYRNSKNKTIIHRIIEISEDENGWYAITKGDNNQNPDEEKIRPEQIKRVLVGIIY